MSPVEHIYLQFASVSNSNKTGGEVDGRRGDSRCDNVSSCSGNCSRNKSSRRIMS